MRDEFGLDGAMIGRPIGNPWIFNEIKHFLNWKLFESQI